MLSVIALLHAWIVKFASIYYHVLALILTYLICKHIHFVCRKYKIVREDSMNMNCLGTSSEEGHLVIDISENVEKDIILKHK